MKTITVSEAEGRLADIISEVNKGHPVVLKNGAEEATLYPGRALDPNEDSPELEAELLKGLDSPLSPYSSDEMRELGEKIIRDAKARQAKV
jgi:antitoxin (DNA-binding transcriptional repressor) of toxin-antitoxin stability system